MKIISSDYINRPPPEPSPKLAHWVDKIKAGWRPNKRIRLMGYSTAAEFYGVYYWEYLNVIYPLLRDLRAKSE